MKELVAKCFLLFLFCVCIKYIGVCAKTSEELRIELPNGNKLVGRTLMSRYGRSFRAFLGIPYAQPPIGSLRFEAPVPFGKWKGELQATKDGNICSQPQFAADAKTVTIVGSEDCLYLNVYTPYRFQSNKPLDYLPVMVFIHGGGFFVEDGTSASYGPDILLDHDIILVTANYRLGPLGFLSTGQEDCPGNFGLKDQLEVLRWIQENIVAFGGDRKSVTIFGQSAGSASVTYLMMSPLTEGLITRAIAQSGTNVDPWAFLPDAKVAPLAEFANCTYSENWSKTIDCLRDASAENITAAMNNFYVWFEDPCVLFVPVVEPDVPDAFITEDTRNRHPQKALSIPLMIGVTHDEGVIRSAALSYRRNLLDDFAKKLESLLPISLFFDHHGNAVQESITKRINKFYFNNEQLDAKKHGENITNLYTDSWFIAGFNEYLQLRLSKQHAAPTFVYLFTHNSSASYSDVYGGDPENVYGVCHGDDLQYIFPVYKTLFSNTLPTEGDLQMRDILPALFVNFATTGDPTPFGSMLPKWNQITKWPSAFYRIGNYDYDDKPMCGMENGGIYEERAEFWRELNAYSLPRNSQTN